jgi:sensor histidine kinase regulating citrate/malate metabolism
VLCCIIALDLQFMMVKKNQLETELDAVSYLLHEKEKQYAMSKESIDLINQKCHDMKHQIGLLGRAQGIEREAVREMEETISVYDSLVKTGNEALDIILSEKTLACHGKGIRLTCVADGGKLNFIRDTDLYSLFGNLIDNAVEATVKLPSEEKRVISLVVKSVKGMVTVNVRNYFTGGLRFENGIPKSTKGDDRYHGFGMKSIQRIVEKYGGNLSVQTDADVFFVNILFPAVAAEKTTKGGRSE